LDILRGEVFEMVIKNKGQVTVFVVIGVVIIVLIIGFFYFKSSDHNLEQINPEIRPLYSFFGNCIEESEKKIIEDLGFTGGIYKEEKSLTWYFYKGESYIPNGKEIESNLSFALKKDLKKCFNGLLNNFKDFDIEGRESTVSTMIEDDKLIFNINYPLTITKDDKLFVLEEFDNEIEVRFGIIYNAALRIIQDQIEHPNSLCMTCIGKFAIENDLYIEIEYYDNSSLIFIIKDENSKINNRAYEFMFINGY